MAQRAKGSWHRDSVGKMIFETLHPSPELLRVKNMGRTCLCSLVFFTSLTRLDAPPTNRDNCAPVKPNSYIKHKLRELAEAA